MFRNRCDFYGNIISGLSDNVHWVVNFLTKNCKNEKNWFSIFWGSGNCTVNGTAEEGNCTSGKRFTFFGIIWAKATLLKSWEDSISMGGWKACTALNRAPCSMALLIGFSESKGLFFGAILFLCKGLKK